MNEVVVAPGSAAIGAEPRVRCLPDVDPLDGPAVVAAARAASAELVVIGPEAPLAAGRRRRAARCRDPRLRADAGGGADRDVEGVLPRGRRGGRGARWRALGRSRTERERRRAPSWPSSAPTGSGVVLKQDGLAAGKGVAVYDDVGLALDHVPSYLRGTRRRTGARGRGAAHGPRGERHRDLRRPRGDRAARVARPQAPVRRRRRSEHRRHGRVLAAPGPAVRSGRRTSSTPSTARSLPSSPGAERRSSASCTRA